MSLVYSKKTKLCRKKKIDSCQTSAIFNSYDVIFKLKQTTKYANHSFPYSIIIPSVSVTDSQELFNKTGSNAYLSSFTLPESQMSLCHMALSSVSVASALVSSD